MAAVDETKVVFTSLDPADAVRGGLISDVDVMVKDILWTMETPEGYHSREPNYFIKGWLTLIEDPNVVEEVWWSAGSKKGHTPCDDQGEPLDEGYRLTGGPLIQGSNAVMFLDSLKSCGFPSDKLKSANLKELVGTEMHVIRKVVEREGLQRAPREDGRTAAGTVVCQKLIRVPGEKRAAKPKPAAAARPAAATAKPAAKAGTTVDHAELAGLAMAEMLSTATNGNLLVSDAKVQANRFLFQKHQLSLEDRNKTITIMLDPVWLEGQGVLLEGESLVLMA